MENLASIDVPDEGLRVAISPNKVLEVERGKISLGSSKAVGRVEIREDGLYLDGGLAIFRRALRCPVKIGGLSLCGDPPEVPRFFYRDIFVESLGPELRLAELYATARLNEGECLAEYLYSIVKGAGFLWDIYYRKTPRLVGKKCGEILSILTQRGLREKRTYVPLSPTCDKWTAAALGLVRFSETLGLVERTWRGFAVAMRYGLYSALKWRLPYNTEMWLLLFGLYGALDPVVMPGGIALDLTLLNRVDYIVARIMGKWLAAFNGAGLHIAVANFNPMVDGARKRAKYASCEGPRCVFDGLYFNICVETECGILRTRDFQFKGIVACRDYGSTFIAVELCNTFK